MGELVIKLAISAPATILLVELFYRCPFLRLTRRLAGEVQRSLRVVRSERISDCWKEKLLPVYALGIFKSALSLAGWLFGFAVTFTIALHFNGLLYNDDFNGLMALRQADYMLLSLLTAFVYIFLRRVVWRGLFAFG